MSVKFYFSIVLIFIALFLGHGASYGQQTADSSKIPWSLTVVIMDGADRVNQAEIPVKEAVAFIEAHSRLVFTVRYVTSSAAHDYTPYKGPDRKPNGRGLVTRYAMMGWNVPKPVINSLPVSSSYLFLYKLKGKLPVQAGSALPLTFGLPRGGKPRPYATVPVDMWWYVNTPQQGFKSWAAQILTHEINNSIQAKIEAAPYKCKQLLATNGLPGNIFEAERLSKFTDKCYAKLGNNAN